MDIFGIGPLELLVILVLILIFVGPQRLPEMAAQLGRFMRTARKMSEEVTREFTTTMKDLEQEYDEVRGEWKEVGQGLEEDLNVVNKELASADKDARKALGEAKSAADGTSPATKDAREAPGQAKSGADGPSGPSKNPLGEAKSAADRPAGTSKDAHEALGEAKSAADGASRPSKDARKTLEEAKSAADGPSGPSSPTG